jgi:hypothetical protein
VLDFVEAVFANLMNFGSFLMITARHSRNQTIGIFRAKLAKTAKLRDKFFFLPSAFAIIQTGQELKKSVR